MRGVLLCTTCKEKIAPAMQPAHSFITSVFSYHDFRMRALIGLLKYRHAQSIGACVSKELAQALLEIVGEESYFAGARKIYLIPVPLSKRRLQIRGYNQAEVLAREMLKHLPAGLCELHTELVAKIRETKPQAEIKRRNTRLSNLTDCFKVAGREKVFHTIFIIDDVTTTGATLIAVRNALKQAGYTKIYALTLAH